jgi:yersiniabactin synthetase, thiazolinyl reductase component
MSRMRVLVCGSNYARTYIPALGREPRKFQLAGVLARGSMRSAQMATLNGVPLYRSTGELPDNIDLACAAMSSAASPVVLQLIRRGIHVLCEHPYPSGWLKKAINLARKCGVQFHVNGHFANLPAAQAFIGECRRARKQTRPQFVEVMATERSLYGSLDILIAAIGGKHPLRVRALSRHTMFVLLEGTLGKIPVRFSVQASGKEDRSRLADGSSGYLLDQRLTVAFPNGSLTLLSTAGPVLWNRTAAHVQNDEDALWTILGGQATRTVAELREQRIQANVEALNSIRRSVLGHGKPEIQQPQHILKVSRAWELIGRQLYGGRRESRAPDRGRTIRDLLP